MNYFEEPTTTLEYEMVHGSIRKDFADVVADEVEEKENPIIGDEYDSIIIDPEETEEEEEERTDEDDDSSEEASEQNDYLEEQEDHFADYMAGEGE